MEENGKVHIVGAGPGDPKLLTLRAFELLKSAEVVLYDRLVSDEILAFISDNAETVDVGKRRSIGCAQQQMHINSLLIAYAREGKTVVRLKGGDPFVFGKGGEEALALREAGIPYEVVPGISSAIAVPASAGIPVTHRGIASSFAVFTGHEAVGQEPQIDWRLAAEIPTAVFLMGVKRLPEICKNLISHGRDPQTPAALIENGTRPNERVISGTLSDITTIAEDVRPPATLVVGEVVRLCSKTEELGTALSSYLEARPSLD